MLSRFFLNGASRDVQRCLGDAHALHARIMSMFPACGSNPARRALGVLHRLELSEREGLVMLLVQSRVPPDSSALPALFLDPHAGDDAALTTSLSPLFAAMTDGAHMRFRLRANPTRKIDTKTGDDGRRRNGKRVPVRRRADDVRDTHEAARVRWLVQKLAAAGLVLFGDDEAPLVRQRPDGLSRARRGRETATHEAHVFEGVAVVRDAALARAAVELGVGPGKAYGFGLLSLAPA